MNPEKIRKDFPIFQEKPELTYLDNAATAQKPETVIEAVQNFYSKNYSNPGRGLYDLAGDATEEYRDSRQKIADFIGALPSEVVFVRGCTEGMNLLASSLENGNVLVPEMAHHSEQLPWRQNGHEVTFVDSRAGKIHLHDLKDKLDENVDYVSLTHVSNIFGAENPVKEITAQAHRNGALVILDAAQSIPHMELDVGDLDVDFMTFSGHKMMGPTGIGVLYGRKKFLEELEPYQVGGGMVKKVTKDKVEFEDLPEKFEAGTQNIAGAVGLRAAVNYVEKVGRDNVREHVRELSNQAREKLVEIEGVQVLSPADAHLVSFKTEFAHPHDIAEILSQRDVAVRAGHHCAQPQMEQMDINGSVRASPYIYNTEEDIEKLVEGVKEAREVFE